MSDRLGPVPQADLLRVLRAAGFEEVVPHRKRKDGGGHLKLRHPDGRTVIVPRHREIAAGTLGSILRQAAMSRAELRRAL
ncbi:MAG: type II toxin-antitoxin system HicA family toxin [Actinomycetota bacterium]